VDPPPRPRACARRRRRRRRERALALLQEKYPQYRGELPDGAVLAVDVTDVLE
jgi:hypothetical protein